MKDELKDLSFEEALAELEALVGRLEAGRIKLDDAVAAYEKAVALKGVCEKKLAAAKLKIEKLEAGADGSPKAVPLDD